MPKDETRSSRQRDKDRSSRHHESSNNERPTNNPERSTEKTKSSKHRSNNELKKSSPEKYEKSSYRDPETIKSSRQAESRHESSRHESSRHRSSRTEKYEVESKSRSRRETSGERRRRKEKERSKLKAELDEKKKREEKEARRKKEKEEKRRREKEDKSRLEREKLEKEKRDKERRDRKKAEEKQKLLDQQKEAEERARKAKETAEKLSKRDGTSAPVQRKRYSSSESSTDDSRLSGEFSDPSEYDISMQPPSSDEETTPRCSTKLGDKAINPETKAEKNDSCSSKSDDESNDGDTVVKRTKSPVVVQAIGSIATKSSKNKKSSGKAIIESDSASFESSDEEDEETTTLVNKTFPLSSKQKQKEINKNSASEDENDDTKSDDAKNNSNDLRWAFNSEDSFQLAVAFYKANLGKTFTPQYSQKVHMHALIKQVRLGSYAALKKRQLPPAPGWFDIFGHDQLESWKKMGRMKKHDARLEFIDELTYLAKSSFAPFMSAHQKHAEEVSKRKREDDERRLREELARRERDRLEKIDRERRRVREEEELEVERERRDEEHKKNEKKRAIMKVLNAQTQNQFQQYAGQQHPGDLQAQQQLIIHLQEKHYEQYLSQLKSQGISIDNIDGDVIDLIPNKQGSGQQNTSNHHSSQLPTGGHQDGGLNKRPPRNLSQNPSSDNIEQVSYWTHPRVKEFKEQIKQDRDSVIQVGRGEVVTIRVPTHEEGNYLFWEFATDNYDLGFGVFFEWAHSEEQDRMSVQQGDNRDNFSENPEDDGFGYGVQHQNQGDRRRNNDNFDMPKRIDEVYPIFRRDSHIEVQAGSHQYPGQGVYLLRFDNSFSLWRSKTLYYRVYYTR